MKGLSNMSDLSINRSYKKGDHGKKVRLIQEWLGLQNQKVAIDGIYGPVTEMAVKEFQRLNGLTVNGIVDNSTFEKLIEPMLNSIKIIKADSVLMNELVVIYAKRHLELHPCEIGGPNSGPWVRLYMKGNQGSTWPWCAGFVSYILKQACATLKCASPIAYHFSCDLLAAQAISKRILLREKDLTDVKNIPLGSFYLQRRTVNDWTHTGIVVEVHDEYLTTIEGNTNDDGSRDGYEVCSMHRGFENKDFILIHN